MKEIVVSVEDLTEWVWRMQVEDDFDLTDHMAIRHRIANGQADLSCTDQLDYRITDVTVEEDE